MYIILILVCESLMSKICQALQHHLKNTIKHAILGGLSLQVFHNCCTSKDIEFCWDDLPKREAKIIWIIWYLPSGNLLHSYWTWQFIADIAIKHCIFPYFSMISYVNVYQRVHVFKRSGVIKRGWLEIPYLCYPAIHLQFGDFPATLPARLTRSHQWPGPFLQKAAAYLRKPSDSKKYTIPQHTPTKSWRFPKSWRYPQLSSILD